MLRRAAALAAGNTTGPAESLHFQLLKSGDVTQNCPLVTSRCYNSNRLGDGGIDAPKVIWTVGTLWGHDASRHDAASASPSACGRALHIVQALGTARALDSSRLTRPLSFFCREAKECGPAIWPNEATFEKRQRNNGRDQ